MAVSRKPVGHPRLVEPDCLAGAGIVRNPGLDQAEAAAPGPYLPGADDPDLDPDRFSRFEITEQADAGALAVGPRDPPEQVTDGLHPGLESHCGELFPDPGQNGQRPGDQDRIGTPERNFSELAQGRVVFGVAAKPERQDGRFGPLRH